MVERLLDLGNLSAWADLMKDASHAQPAAHCSSTVFQPAYSRPKRPHASRCCADPLRSQISATAVAAEASITSPPEIYKRGPSHDSEPDSAILGILAHNLYNLPEEPLHNALVIFPVRAACLTDVCVLIQHLRIHIELDVAQLREQALQFDDNEPKLRNFVI
eukprot:CAMPEP_0115185768 /NCGR_PEP_ID=MMETSP0270-20121206/9641_1 /TAXON_ID=71861 /ORGANISM="Scrippsiella trochoidea, Strain CCMP3099" /LENGTH=161 /DNA_ID=CAMNT_0002598881 /DNA_START=809 /DNA_END=1295 /DNA_ORIENTATION=+